MDGAFAVSVRAAGKVPTPLPSAESPARTAVVEPKQQINQTANSRTLVLVFLFPDALEPSHRAGRQPLGLRAEQRGQGLAEIARAHAFEVQPRDQLLDALGPSPRRTSPGADCSWTPPYRETRSSASVKR